MFFKAMNLKLVRNVTQKAFVKMERLGRNKDINARFVVLHLELVRGEIGTMNYGQIMFGTNRRLKN